MLLLLPLPLGKQRDLVPMRETLFSGAVVDRAGGVRRSRRHDERAYQRSARRHYSFAAQIGNLGEEGVYNKDGTRAQQESRAQVAKGETWKQKRANMRASVSMRCASAHVRVCARARARARSLVATLPGGGPAEDGSELRSHACGVAKVEARGHAPGVGRIVIITVTPREVRP